jgi:hypothetical protein
LQFQRWRRDMHVNKVHRVTTIDRVAADLGESVHWLHDVSMARDAEDGVIWVYGPGDDQVMAFTDFGIDTLVELIKEHRNLSDSNPETRSPAAYAGCVRFNQQGPDGLRDIRADGVGPRLSSESMAELAAIVGAGPDCAKDGVVRWRRVDLKRVARALRR